MIPAYLPENNTLKGNLIMKLVILSAFAIAMLAACDTAPNGTPAKHTGKSGEYLIRSADGKSYFNCRQSSITRISAKSFQCDGELYFCAKTAILVKCNNGDTYLNPTDIKIE